VSNQKGNYQKHLISAVNFHIHHKRIRTLTPKKTPTNDLTKHPYCSDPKIKKVLAIYYLTINQLEKINNRFTGNLKTEYAYKGGVEFILSNVVDLYENLSEKDAIIAKAAYLWYSIASNQYLIHANKRTGYAIVDAFLKLNKMGIAATQDEKFALSRLIAARAYQVDHVRQFITKSLKEVV